MQGEKKKASYSVPRVQFHTGSETEILERPKIFSIFMTYKYNIGFMIK